MAKKNLTTEEKALRDEYRRETLGAPTVIDSKRVEWRGKAFDVRAPSLREQQRIESLSKGKDGSRDNLKALFVAIANCVFIADTEILVFEDADEEAISERGTKDFVGVFMNALSELGKEVSVESVEKNS